MNLPSFTDTDISPQIKSFFDNVLKYQVDPSGEYYGVTLNSLQQELLKLNNIKAIAIDNDTDYDRKGYMYDPILQNFILGCGGQIATWDKAQKSNAPVVLRGVTKRKEMQMCRDSGRNFYYIDTGYFGNGKHKIYHRVTLNNLQNLGPIKDRPRDRLAATKTQLKKFRPGGKILLAPPSQKLLNVYDINLEAWIEDTIKTIKKYTDREIITRTKQSRSVRVNDDTMEMALSQDVHCLVTFSSIAATEALLLGKPAFTLGPNAAAPLCKQDLSQIETPYIPSLMEVEHWAAHLAYCQFTVEEMRNGTAWSILNNG